MKNRLLRKTALVAAVAALIGCTLTGCKKDDITPIKDAIDAELGVEMSTDAKDYVTGEDKVLSDTTVDVSGVDVTKLGEYEMTVSFKKEVETIKVTVKDTTAPEADVEQEVVVLAGEPVDVMSFVNGIREYTNEVEIGLKDHAYTAEDVESTEEVPATEEVVSTEQEEIPYDEGYVHCNAFSMLYEEAGEYDNILTFTDENGNTAEYPIHVIVCTEPVIEGLKDIEVEVGTEIDYLEGITATDGAGNDLTESIKVESDTVDTSKAGTYSVAYTVTNEYGYSTTETITVTVKEKQVASNNGGNNGGSNGGASNGGGSNGGGDAHAGQVQAPWGEWYDMCPYTSFYTPTTYMGVPGFFRSHGDADYRERGLEVNARFMGGDAGNYDRGSTHTLGQWGFPDGNVYEVDFCYFYNEADGKPTF